jgi:hypothetical protein
VLRIKEANTMTVATKNKVLLYNIFFIFLLYLSQRRFILEITQKLPINVGVSFINKKAPVRRLDK